MYFFLIGIVIYVIGAGWSLSVRNRTSQLVGPITAVCGSSLVAVASILVLLGRNLDLILPWKLPLGSFHIGLDPLSAIFILPVAVISAIAAIYGHGYLHDDANGKKLSFAW